jgi:hypothetical protein
MYRLTTDQVPECTVILNDCINASLLTASFPHLAHRLWAIIRTEFIKYDEHDSLVIDKMTASDRMDPGNYREGDGSLRAYIALAAAEFGDERIRGKALEQLDAKFFPVEVTKTGSLRNVGLSASSQAVALMARIGNFRDLERATREGPAEAALTGPLLSDAPFPEVLVAKAYSRDSKQLDLVLYNGQKPGKFRLGFERLVPEKRYSIGSDTSIVADRDGKGFVDLEIHGRTQVLLVENI